MISFNPHLMYKSVTDDLVSDPSKDYVSACLKQLIVDEVNKIFLISFKVIY